MAEVAYSIHGERVFVRYKDLVEDALTAGLTAEELIAAANAKMAEESESGEAKELPVMKELMSLKTRLAKEVVVPAEESASESGEAAPKYVVVASLRYMTEKAEESESL